MTAPDKQNRDIALQEEAGPWLSTEYVAGLVSVVIPTHNRGDVIRETLDAVRAQSYRPLEIVIVDDGSTDGTAELVDHWAEEHRCADFGIRYVHQARRGPAAARNAGARLATGEFVQFLDSDDLPLPEKIVESLNAIKAQGAGFAACDVSYFEGSARNIVETVRFSLRSAAPASHVAEVKLNTVAPVLRREALNAAGPWSEDLEVWVDLEWTFRLLTAPVSGVWLPKVLCLVRISERSVTNTAVATAWEFKRRACRKIERRAVLMHLYDRRLRNNIGRRLAAIARLLAQDGNWADSRGVFLEARARLSVPNKLLHSAHRVLMRVVGCRNMRRIGLM